MLRYNGKELTLTGTDLEVEISAQVSCKGGDNGEMTVPARKLHDICRALPNEALIDISLEKEKALIKSGKSRFRLLTMPARNSQPLKQHNGIQNSRCHKASFAGCWKKPCFAWRNRTCVIISTACCLR